ncbi:MAG: glycosyl hydrolase family 32 domain protein [Candidatus Marinimicrobia bacterium]|nr:glycosyl hydrolase family 32 domain protein [Candidatus Neomarinimicrobiota bacterium]
MKISLITLRVPILIFSFCLATVQSQEENFVPGGTIPEGHPDYTSKVPKYKFSNTLKKQEKELKKNPLLKRFAKSRKAMAGEPHLPNYHFVSPENRLNDPNGLSYWKGKWHLFYQGYPPEDPRQHWGHAVSDDLIHWRDLPYAIYPNPERAVFSGTTLVEEDRVIAMYHGTRIGNMVATSSDPLLLNWDKVTEGAPISILNPDNLLIDDNDKHYPYRVFDPSIWKEGEYYYSLSAGQKPEGPGGSMIRANWLFRSKDLANWEYLHPFIENDQYSLVGDDGACPYFWPIGNKHIYMQFSHMSGGKYLIGDYNTDRDKFEVTGGGDFNFGTAWPNGVHAPSATPEPLRHAGATDGKGVDGAVIIIFNMNPGKPTEGYDQIMSLPRRLTLNPEPHININIEPVGDFASLRYNHKKVESMDLPANKEIVLDGINGKSMEIMAEIDLNHPEKDENAPWYNRQAPTTIEMGVFRSSTREEVTRILFTKGTGYRSAYLRRFGSTRRSENRIRNIQSDMITIESSRSSVLSDATPRIPESAPVFLGEDETLKLHVFIDKSIVEVFVNGQQCVAQRVYPGLDDSDGISFRAQGRDMKIVSLDAWEMKNIYD